MLRTYNVLEAAIRLGARSYGIRFEQGDRRPRYVPVDEGRPIVPEDAHDVGVAGEVTARSFHARTGADIYGRRINNVIGPHECAELFPAFRTDP